MTPPNLSPLDDHSLNRLVAAIDARRPKNSGMGWLERALLWVVSAALAWAALQTDVAVLKSRVNGQDQMLQEMRQDIKTLLQRRP